MVNKQQWKVTFLLCTSDLPQWEIFLHWQENALLFFFFLVNVENLKMYLQLFVTTSHLYRAVQAQRVSVSSTEVPRSIKQSLSDTWKGKGGFASLQPCSPSKAPAWLCRPGRHRVVGKGQSRSRPSPHFHLLPSCVSAAGTGASPQQTPLMLPELPRFSRGGIYTFLRCCFPSWIPKLPATRLNNSTPVCSFTFLNSPRAFSQRCPSSLPRPSSWAVSGWDAGCTGS